MHELRLGVLGTYLHIWADKNASKVEVTKMKNKAPNQKMVSCKKQKRRTKPARSNVNSQEDEKRKTKRPKRLGDSRENVDFAGLQNFQHFYMFSNFLNWPNAE